MSLKEISFEEKLSWIRLARMSKASSRAAALNLVKQYGSATAVIKQATHLLNDEVISEELAAKELANSQKFPSEIIAFADQDYPASLRDINDPPLVLTVSGNKQILGLPAIAIVGARNASTHGMQFAKKIASDLVSAGLIVVSGLARGIDRAAHEGALETGADKTIGVIAGGIDNVYPFENRDIYQKISKNGAIISENSFGAPPKSMHFPARNRIISALALGTVVIEAGLRSGTLITAKYALEQGKEVFAVPGFPADPRCQGTNHLIKQGAKLIESAEDVLAEFAYILPELLKKNSAKTASSTAQVVQERGKVSSQEPAPAKAPQATTEIHHQILSRLNYTPIEAEAIIKDLGMSARAFNVALAELELADKIEVNYGKLSRKKI